MKKRVKAVARVSALFRLIKPHLAHKRNAFSEDLRKLGIYAIGLGLVAYIAAGDKITDSEAIAIEVAGIVMWVVGLVFARIEED
ncbi:MAG: hypothetical protein AB2669_08105 [Candidatus Thiodiazotropha endolucinida]|nr:hypothetical protein [Candidatus Thiodiazotropha taylori]MCW4250164.1 hypothetical protein [Candidatus Thiodiazotropha endolucinida]MCG7883549.1 hypothetical protein [Candidatus Thiodiazotropha taylori]MCG8058716.1 hypothetical protein [Candidatus Thiodiazotropha taylori]MCG8104607.1 hypothetical protein [Candidatus Thiodiazotropha taylori]